MKFSHLFSTDLQSFRSYFSKDAVAGFSVALVALPLSLGIAMGAGLPPISGVISAIVGGLLATFIRGSHVGINGAGNSLIVILATALAGFGGAADAFPDVLGVVVVSGAIQFVLGLVRAGKLAEITPTAVIQGLLAAIGLIIVGKQLHVVFGQQAEASNPIEVYMDLPQSIAALNPILASIGLVSVLILAMHPRFENRFVRAFSAPLVVVLLSVPLVMLCEAVLPPSGDILGWHYDIGPKQLVPVPDDLSSSFVSPSFSRIGEFSFWSSVALVTLVTSIENVVSVKAVDKLDPERRSSDLDRDLGAMGLCTVVAGMLGGLPVLTVVARSSVNVNHGARSSWSNFYHGACLLLFIVALKPLIREIPLSALAAILVYTGYRLASPKVVARILEKGPEHLVVFVATVTATLVWGLLFGVVAGIVVELVLQLLVLQLPPRQIMSKMLAKIHVSDDDGHTSLVRVDGVANFINVGRLRRALFSTSADKHTVVDLSRALLVDPTLLEACGDIATQFGRDRSKRRFDIVGLEAHQAFCAHPSALRWLSRPLSSPHLTDRQRAIRKFAKDRGYSFSARRNSEPQMFANFYFLRAHPLERLDTTLEGHFEIDGERVEWQLGDLTFDEGRLLPRVYHSTALVLFPPEKLLAFMLERTGRLRRVVRPRLFRRVDISDHGDLSSNYHLYAGEQDEARRLIDAELLQILSSAHRAYHLESDRQGLLLFSDLRLASQGEVEEMIDLAQQVAENLLAKQQEASSS